MTLRSEIGRPYRLIFALCVILAALSDARANEGGGDSALRAELQKPHLLDDYASARSGRYLIGDRSQDYDARLHPAKPTSTYTRYRQ